jgi:phosphopantothenoylcysteine decarboxylase/phosphopantothenoylcysteine decarboxylase/phosphopantothenate--cysteine ligase
MSAPVIVLGITGSIAAYRAADLASQLVKAGADVHVIMTPHACDFITPLTMQTMSRNPVVTAAWNAQSNWKPGHIELADRADLLLIAPATANVIAELAHGLAGHPLTEVALATRAPLLIAPAMNGKMWEHPATRANVELLKSRGAEFVGPEAGVLACGYEGLGRLAAVTDIVARTLAKLPPVQPSQKKSAARKVAPEPRRPRFS